MDGSRTIVFNKVRIRRGSYKPMKGGVAEELEFICPLDQLGADALGRKPQFFDANGTQVTGVKRVELENQYFGAKMKLVPPQQGSLFTDAGAIMLKTIAVHDFKAGKKETGFAIVFKARIDGTSEVVMPFLRSVTSKEITVEIDRVAEAEEEAARQQFESQMKLPDDADDGEAEDSGEELEWDTTAGSLDAICREDGVTAALKDEAGNVLLTFGENVAAPPAQTATAAPQQAFPEPGEDGTFNLDEAEHLDWDGQGCEAKLYWIESKEGFHSDFYVHFRIGTRERHEARLSIGTAVLSEQQAIAQAAASLFEFAGNLISRHEHMDKKVTPKQRNLCVTIRNWLDQYMERQKPAHAAATQPILDPETAPTVIEVEKDEPWVN